jgi:hypothetical protein
VYSPDEETVPPVAVQVTAVFVEPVTVAVNCCVPFAWIAAAPGEIETATGAATVTVAAADFVLSATLLAVIV